MKTIALTLLIAFIATTGFAWDASSVEVRDDLDFPYKLMSGGTPNEVLGYYKGTEEITQEEYDNYEPYNPDTFIAWCMVNVMTPELAPHYFAVCDAANKNSKGGWANLLAYGQAMGIGETVSVIINEATNQGANV